MTTRRLLVVVVLVIAALGAFVYLGPDSFAKVAAHTIVAAIVYQLIRAVFRHF